MSNSYKTEVNKPLNEQKPKKVKRQFNKRLRNKTKQTITDYINKGLLEEADDLYILEDSNE